MKLFRLRLVRIAVLVAALVICCGGCAQGESRSLTILHVNDLHARFLPDEEGRGGFAELATAIRREREKSPGALVLNAGDLVQGTPVSSIYEGVPCYEVASAMGFDAATLGNHEFDYTWRKIPEFFRAASFPIVCANVVRERGELLAPRPYVILRANGVRVGVIGALMEHLELLTKARQRGPWRVLPVVETVRRYVWALREKTDLIVVLGHLFAEEEDQLLREVPEVSLVVSGHNHGGLRRPKNVDGRLCVRVLAYGAELGRLDLKVDVPGKRIASYEWRRIPIDRNRYPPDAAVAALVRNWEARVSALVDVPIGVAERRLGRSEVKKLIEEAMAEAVAADIAYTNFTGIRDLLPPGRILVRQVWKILPFGNRIVYGKVKGSQIPAEATGGRRVEPGRDYILATNDFVAEQWRRSGGPALEKTGPLVREAFIDFIKEKKVLR